MAKAWNQTGRRRARDPSEVTRKDSKSSAPRRKSKHLCRKLRQYPRVLDAGWIKAPRLLVKLKPSIDLEGPRIFSQCLSSPPLWPAPSLESRACAKTLRAGAPISGCSYSLAWSVVNAVGTG